MLCRLRRPISENDEGFTLIELLVVILIIGILAAIAIPVFLNQRKKGYDASMKSDLRTVANEEETYFTDYQTYAAVTTSGATPPIATVTSGDTVTLSTGNTVVTDTAAAGGKGYGGNGYCLKVTSTKDSGKTYWYDSQSGGLRSTSCVAVAFG